MSGPVTLWNYGEFNRSPYHRGLIKGMKICWTRLGKYARCRVRCNIRHRVEHFSTAALGKAWLPTLFAQAGRPFCGTMAELRKALEKVGTRVHRRGPNFKNWSIRKVVARSVRLTTSECLTKAPVLAIPAERRPLRKVCLLEALWWRSVCQKQIRFAAAARAPTYRNTTEL